MTITYVYVISDGEFGKVGVAEDTAKRCRQLQAGNARRLVVDARLECWTRPMAFRVERLLHERIRSQQLLSEADPQGEWFALEDAHEAIRWAREQMEREVWQRTAEPVLPSWAIASVLHAA